MSTTTSERHEQIVGEITALKSLLRDTDYSIYKLVENLSDCKTLDGMIDAFTVWLAKYQETVEHRRSWREKINALEEEESEIIEAEAEAARIEAEEEAARIAAEEEAAAEAEIAEIAEQTVNEIPVNDEVAETIVDEAEEPDEESGEEIPEDTPAGE